MKVSRRIECSNPSLSKMNSKPRTSTVEISGGQPPVINLLNFVPLKGGEVYVKVSPEQSAPFEAGPVA